jgi:ABC-type antimicrobial peptide transport system permease subunit
VPNLNIVDFLVRVVVSGNESRVNRSFYRLEQQVDASLGQERVLAALSSGFALLALLLASVGLFGMMSYNVARRTREIGIRMALGARRSMVLRRILQETVTVSVAGILIGLAGALATTRLVAAFLFELSPRDPSTLLATAVVLMATTMAAGWLPARRAAAVDPMRALRNE